MAHQLRVSNWIINHPMRSLSTRIFIHLTILFARPESKINALTFSTSLKCSAAAPDQSKVTPIRNELPPKHATVVVKRSKQSQSFREGSPLVFSGAISHTLGLRTTAAPTDDAVPVKLGTLVTVSVAPKNKNGRRTANNEDYPHRAVTSEETLRQELRDLQPIGMGVYNPHSMYRVRILCHETLDPATFRRCRDALARDRDDGGGGASSSAVMSLILAHKLREAVRTRARLNLPSPGTDSYRLVNGEGDGLSGLCVDVLGGEVAVIMSSAAWCEIYREEILEALREALLVPYPSGLELIWRRTDARLKQDGYASPPEEEETKEGGRHVIAKESNLSYKTFPWSGQKTGFYCDQRDNRQIVAKLCRDKRVLDLCCYNGSFALNAALAGAKSCVGVDSSPDAIAAARENASFNDLNAMTIFVRDDISKFMKSAYDEGDERYDVVVLDPPKLAPSMKGLERAARKYQALNRDAIKLVSKEGGLLFTCTCSGAMTQKEGGQYFLKTVKAASVSAGRRLSLLGTWGAASCHTRCPASFPAGDYLTAALFSVGPEKDT